MLGITFEYVGDSKLYIDNLEKLIIFSEGLYFTERVYDIETDSPQQEEQVCLFEGENEQNYIQPEQVSLSHIEEEKPEEDDNKVQESLPLAQTVETSQEKAASYKIPVFSCKECNVTFTTSKGLSYHNLKVHIGIRSWCICEICSAKFFSKSDLNKHMDHVHLGVKFTCDICGKNYAQRGALNKHIQGVHEKVTYKCKECPRQTTQTHVLNLHMKKEHPGIEYSCGDCDFKAITTHRMDKHRSQFHTDIMKVETIHRGVKESVKFTCNQCDYNVTSKKKLGRHVTSKHKGISIEMFSCDLCDFKSTQKSYLHKHQKTAHEGQGFVCQLCDKLFPSERSLAWHMKSKKHKQIVEDTKNIGS